MSNYDLFRNTICKYDDNDYIILFKDDESAKTVFDEFNQKDQRIAELEKEKQTAVKEFANEILNMWSNYSAKEESDIFSFYYHFEDNILELLKERGIE